MMYKFLRLVLYLVEVVNIGVWKEVDQDKFLRQGWVDNNLPKIFRDMGCISFILD